jgi:hypothetical protein
MVIGWPAVRTEFVANKANVAEISVKPLDMHVRVNGDTAWVFGTEEGAALPKVGISASGTPEATRWWLRLMTVQIFTKAVRRAPPPSVVGPVNLIGRQRPDAAAQPRSLSGSFGQLVRCRHPPRDPLGK